MSLFDTLEDETLPTTGEEIGSALAVAVGEINKSNEQMVAMIGNAITDALKAVESKAIDVTVNEKQGVKKWAFKVERDDNGFLTHITATAHYDKKGSAP